jgi:Domain of unknown function (DUF4345)
VERKIWGHKNLYLGMSSIIVIIVGLAYGLYPQKLMPLFFDFKVETTDLSNVFRAIMGLYIGLGIYFIVGIKKQQYYKNATLICTIFMGGLAFGRIISIVIDGIPSPIFAIGTILELLFMIWGIRNLNQIEK